MLVGQRAARYSLACARTHIPQRPLASTKQQVLCTLFFFPRRASRPQLAPSLLDADFSHRGSFRMAKRKFWCFFTLFIPLLLSRRWVVLNHMQALGGGRGGRGRRRECDPIGRLLRVLLVSVSFLNMHESRVAWDCSSKGGDKFHRALWGLFDFFVPEMFTYLSVSRLSFDRRCRVQAGPSAGSAPWQACTWRASQGHDTSRERDVQQTHIITPTSTFSRLAVLSTRIVVVFPPYMGPSGRSPKL